MPSQNGPAGDSDEGDPPLIRQGIRPIQFADPVPTQEPVPSVRASDADRERAIDALIEAFAEGRLTTEELSARTEQAYQARTYAELAMVSADLPAVPPASPPAAQPAGPATDLTATAQRRTNSLAVAALVCSLIPGPPGLAALILGIVALRQIRRTGERGTALAAAALAIVTLGPLITLLLVL